MSGQRPPVYAQDYSKSGVKTKYGYFAKVLRPGMSASQIETEIKKLQATSKFVVKLSDPEIQDFINNFEILDSSSMHKQALDAGLDALILRSKTTQYMAVAIGGVGPVLDVNTAVTEGLKFRSESANYGFSVYELLALKSFFDPLKNKYNQDVIEIFAHSKGVPIGQGLFGDMKLSGGADRVNLVFGLSPAGWNSTFIDNPIAEKIKLTSKLIDLDILAYAKSIYEAVNEDASGKMLSFGVVGDRVTGRGSFSHYFTDNNKYFGTYRELLDDRAFTVPHNAGTAGRLLGISLNNAAPLFMPSPALLLQARTDGEIVVIGRKTIKAITPRVVDPRTRVLLPKGLRLQTQGDLAITVTVH